MDFKGAPESLSADSLSQSSESSTDESLLDGNVTPDESDLPKDRTEENAETNEIRILLPEPPDDRGGLHGDVSQSDILECPSYTDSITSNDSRTALLKSSENEAHVHLNEATDLSHTTYLNIVNTEAEPTSNKSSLWDISDFGHEIEYRSKRHKQMKALSECMESAAYIDSLVCPSPDVNRLRSACRNAVLSLSQEVVNKSMSVLAINEKGLKVVSEVEVDIEEIKYINNHLKNLIFLSIGITLMNIAVGSLRNLQSSLNDDGGVGLYSLAASFGAFTIFSLFSPFIIQRFRPKKCLVMGLIPQLLYVIANVMPTYYILVPASFLQGMGNVLIWNAMSTYTSYLARVAALKNNEKTLHVASRYFGIFFFFYQLSVVVGNLISSIILLLGPKSSDNMQNMPVEDPVLLSNNSASDIYNASFDPLRTRVGKGFSICGSAYCHSYKIEHEGMVVDMDTKYTLFGVFGMSVVFSLVVCGYLLDPVKTYKTHKLSCFVITKHLQSLWKCFFSQKFLMISGVFIYSSMQLGFVTAEVTKAFVTCPVGIFMVGYTMIMYGLCGGLSSFIGGRLCKHVGRVALIAFAAVLNLTLLVVMAFWRPHPDQPYALFILLGAWGIGDGIWISQTNSVISALFPKQLEEGFALYRMLSGLGATIVFAYANFLCMTQKMYILAGVCTVGTALYIAVEILEKQRNSKDQEQEEENDI